MPLKGTDSKAPVCQVGAGETALSRTAMRHAIRAHYGHWYLWIWGLIWLAMALLGHFLGPSARPTSWPEFGSIVTYFGSVF